MLIALTTRSQLSSELPLTQNQELLSESSIVLSEDEPSEPVSTSVHKCFTVIASFEDPGVQMIFKQILSKEENKLLLRKYEAALPSWTIAMA